MMMMIIIFPPSQLTSSTVVFFTPDLTGNCRIVSRAPSGEDARDGRPWSVLRLRAAGLSTLPLPPPPPQPKSNIDDAAACLADGFITRLVGSRGERDLCASGDAPPLLFCNVANNVVIAPGKTDDCNQMRALTACARSSP